jgi:EAL domain
MDLVTVYQPKVDLRSELIVGVEALVRWPHPERGLLSPEQFLPLVRQHGLMRAVTERVLAQALDDALAWHCAGARIPVCVNLFAASLTDPTLGAHIVDALAQRELNPHSLIIEIIEDLLVEDTTRARPAHHTARVRHPHRARRPRPATALLIDTTRRKPLCPFTLSPVLGDPVTQGARVHTQAPGDLGDRLTGLPDDAYRTLPELRIELPSRIWHDYSS